MHVEERRYEILDPLGKGGFGTVYRARYLGEGGFTQLVALKVLNAEMAKVEEVASRLRDEARVLGLVRHRAIVQVHRLARLNGSWTVVMEYVHGADLAQLLAAGKPVPVGPALEIVAEVAAALSVAWTAPGVDGRPLRLLHRDIKPSNVQITDVGEVKVLDFGIARADFDSREALTRNLAFGSVEYMAPERLDLIDGPKADVYSLGVVLYEMLTCTPFGRTSAAQRRHDPRLAKAMDKLKASPAGKHRDVVALVASMLQWDPEQRPTARQVERRSLAMLRVIDDEPLRFWAEDVVPHIMSNRPAPVTDPLTGSIMIEHIRDGSSADPVLPPEDTDDNSGYTTPFPVAAEAPNRVPDLAHNPTLALPADDASPTPLQLGGSSFDVPEPAHLAAADLPGPGALSPTQPATAPAAPAPRSDPGQRPGRALDEADALRRASPAHMAMQQDAAMQEDAAIHEGVAPLPPPDESPAAQPQAIDGVFEPKPPEAESSEAESSEAESSEAESSEAESSEAESSRAKPPVAFVRSDTDPDIVWEQGQKRQRRFVAVLGLAAAALAIVAVVMGVVLGGGEPAEPPAEPNTTTTEQLPAEPAAEPTREAAATEPAATEPAATEPAATEPAQPAADRSDSPDRPATATANRPLRDRVPSPPAAAAAAQPAATQDSPAAMEALPEPTASTASSTQQGTSAASTEEAARGMVRVSGHTGAIELQANGRSYIVTTSRELPPGDYTVRADFGSGDRFVAGSAVVRSGSTTLIVCDAAFQECYGR